MRKIKFSGYKIASEFSTENIAKIYFVFFSILILTLIYFQIIKGEYYFKRAKNNYLRTIPQESMRGVIYDRNDIPLAFDRAAFNISIIPYQIKHNKNIFLKKVSEFSGQSLVQIYQNYEKNIQTNFSPVDILTDIDKETAFNLKEEFGNNILINPKPQRYYAHPYAFSHLLGYVKKASAFYPQLRKYGYTPLERIGILGLEQYYDAYLRGEDGGSLIEVDVKGKMVGFLGEKKPKKGKDIYITIDSRLQEIALQSLGEKRGVIILMDSNNGELLVLLSSPSFNLNDFTQGNSTKELMDEKSTPLLNRAIQALYPLGSTFKPIMAIAALEEKKILPSDSFHCTGNFKLGANNFSCWSTHGTQNLSDALANSCNVYFYNLGLKIGAELISKWAKIFGLNSLTGIDLPYENKGFVPSPKWKEKELKRNWFAGETVNFSIGQGYLTATPLENLIAINVIANNGYLVVPHLLKRIDHLKSEFSVKNYLPISDKNRQIVKNALHETVIKKSGTAHMLAKFDLDIAGKTGTAQVSNRKPHGWFIGFFPFEKPKYILLVFLEYGSSSHEALSVVEEFLNKAQEAHLL